MEELHPLAPDTAPTSSQTSPSRAEQKRIEYDVHGPSVSPYFTLRIAVQAAPVPPLPFIQSQRKHKHKQKQKYNQKEKYNQNQKIEKSTVWETSSSSSLRHRWRFIKQEELGLWRPSYDTTGPAVELGKEDQLLPLLLQHHQQHQHQQQQPIVQKEKEEKGEKEEKEEKGEKEKSPRITLNGSLSRRAKSEGAVIPPRSRSVRGKRGWLEEILQDDEHRNIGFRKSQNTTNNNNNHNNNNNNNTTSLPYLRAEERSDQLPQVPAKTNSLSTSTVLSERPMQLGSKTDKTTGGDRTNTLESTTTTTTTTTATDAAQRLRVTLLTNSFQRMVDDVVQMHGYSGVERAQLLRHAGIFRELSLQSRYHEMHPLCHIRLVGSEFRTGQRRSVSAPGSRNSNRNSSRNSNRNNSRNSNNRPRSSKQPYQYMQRKESRLLSPSESTSTGMRTEDALVAVSAVSE